MNIALENILKKCLDKNNNTRSEGEKEINTLANQDFGLLLESCSEFLADESKQVQLRQLSATLIKNLVNNIVEHKGKWTRLPEEQKAKIKQNTFQCLGSSSKDIRKASGLCVAGNQILT